MNLGPKPEEKIGPCPEDESSEVKEVWDRLSYEWKLLLSAQDRDQFLIYCRMWAEMDECYQLCQKYGSFSEDFMREFAPSKRFLALSVKLHAMARSFGATPVDRNRIPGKTLTPADRKKMSLELLT